MIFALPDSPHTLIQKVEYAEYTLPQPPMHTGVELVYIYVYVHKVTGKRVYGGLARTRGDSTSQLFRRLEAHRQDLTAFDKHIAQHAREYDVFYVQVARCETTGHDRQNGSDVDYVEVLPVFRKPTQQENASSSASAKRQKFDGADEVYTARQFELDLIMRLMGANPKCFNKKAGLQGPRKPFFGTHSQYIDELYDMWERGESGSYEFKRVLELTSRARSVTPFFARTGISLYSDAEGEVALLVAETIEFVRQFGKLPTNEQNPSAYLLMQGATFPDLSKSACQEIAAAFPELMLDFPEARAPNGSNADTFRNFVKAYIELLAHMRDAEIPFDVSGGLNSKAVRDRYDNEQLFENIHKVEQAPGILTSLLKLKPQHQTEPGRNALKKETAQAEHIERNKGPVKLALEAAHMANASSVVQRGPGSPGVELRNTFNNSNKVEMTRGALLRLKRVEAYYEHLDEELLPPTSHVRKWFEAKLYAVRAWHALHVWADRVRDGEPDAVYALPTRVQAWGDREREELCAKLRGAGHAHIEGMTLPTIFI
ncbi:hypothetical protein T492DRAFT_836225 [Pavlovales sp. CCMP2436]|nr:hypothetical protein T492DRAFT_836225 [Pavlovales sp. CCMP2436]